MCPAINPPVLAKMAAVNWIFIAIAAVIVLSMILRPFRKAAQTSQRGAIFAQMGLHEVSRNQVFGDNSQPIARVIRDRPDSSISNWVGTGAREGEVALFQFSGEASDANVNKWIVIGFRLPAPLPDFEICHLQILDRLIARFATAPVTAPPVVTAPPAERKFGPFTVRPRDVDRPPQHRIDIQTNPDFAKNYAVWAADAAATQRMLTPSLLDKLVVANSKTIHILSGRGWLFIYHWGSSATPEAKYPELFDEAVELFSSLNLTAGTTPAEPRP